MQLNFAKERKNTEWKKGEKKSKNEINCDIVSLILCRYPFTIYKQYIYSIHFILSVFVSEKLKWIADGKFFCGNCFSLF